MYTKKGRLEKLESLLKQIGYYVRMADPGDVRTRTYAPTHPMADLVGEAVGEQHDENK